MDYVSSEEVENILQIPYSSTPPFYDIRVVMPFDADKWKMFQTQFGGMATLPPDWRLNLEFQKHVLRGEDKSSRPIDRAALDAIESCYSALHAIGGSFKVREIGSSRSWVYQYGTTGQQTVTASDLEVFVDFPATTMKVTRGWKPNSKSNFNALRWKRIM